ncbi:hypothetical protein N7541_001731 [Penicillium brevicompactum]|uniref:Methyltransferase domain-containing protein n=1 Tax=Penicillium brevicompactum TaxID=5074 RepID=A0A9W9RWU9_PENBR|nr:hypothetical protein N7541_001731 [Penicillium brevicompactum]
MSEFTEANRKYFDKLAASYKGRFADASRMLASQTLQHRSWISDRWTDTESGSGKEIKMLEYACGPGVVSMSLAPFVTQIVGIDVSDNMVAEFNRNAASLGLADKVVGYKADLLSEDAPVQDVESACTNLDMVTVSMALHHFEHPDFALQRLAGRLNQGGVCYIIDLVAHSDAHGHGHEEHEHNFAEAAHTIKTHGFSQVDMQRLFEDAGLTGFEYKVLPEPLTFNTDERSFSKTVFIARAQRV